MWLNVVWFVLFGVIVAGYLVLDGFDLGCGILHPFIAQNDTERRVVLNSIGPVWDGNEVWLVLLGGVLFGVFPLVYASLFSGLYVAFMLVLLCLILRAVAIEFRSQRSSPEMAYTLGLRFFPRISGSCPYCSASPSAISYWVCRVQSNGNISVSLIQLLSPFALLVGLTTICMFAMHGAIYLSLKTDGELNARVHRWLPRIMIVFFILNTLVVIGTLILHLVITKRYLNDIWPIIVPALALGALILSWYMLRRGRSFLRLHRLRSRDHLADRVSSRRDIPESSGLDHQLFVRSQHIQRRVGQQYPGRDADLRHHRNAPRPALHHRRVLHLPGQGHP